MITFINQHRILTGALAAVALPLLALSLVITLDVRGLDPSEPLDWDAMELTEAGFRESGTLIDLELDCTTGRLRAETPLLDFGVKTVDAPWVGKHKADEACERHGFDPDF